MGTPWASLEDRKYLWYQRPASSSLLNRSSLSLYLQVYRSLTPNTVSWDLVSDLPCLLNSRLTINNFNNATILEFFPILNKANSISGFSLVFEYSSLRLRCTLGKSTNAADCLHHTKFLPTHLNYPLRMIHLRTESWPQHSGYYKLFPCVSFRLLLSKWLQI